MAIKSEIKIAMDVIRKCMVVSALRIVAFDQLTITHIILGLCSSGIQFNAYSQLLWHEAQSIMFKLHHIFTLAYNITFTRIVYFHRTHKELLRMRT